MARSLLVEMEAEGRLRSACDLLRHVSWAEFVEEEIEEVRRRAGRTTGLARHGAVESFTAKSGGDNTFWMNVDGQLGEFCGGTPLPRGFNLNGAFNRISLQSSFKKEL